MSAAKADNADGSDTGPFQTRRQGRLDAMNMLNGSRDSLHSDVTLKLAR